MSTLARTFTTTSLAALVFACSSASETTTTPAALPFKPSNVDLSTWDLSGIGDVDLSGAGCVVDGEEAEGPVAFLCDKDFTNKGVHKIVTLPDQTRLSVFVVRSLRVEASTVLEINRGHLPVVLVATETMELVGSIDVGPGTTGGSFDAMAFSRGVGPGGGTAGDATGLAGGGGSYCGLGGKGGTTTATPGNPPVAPTPAYGTSEIVPLVAGSAGGSGALSNDVGAGGGALEIFAGTSFALHKGAFVNVGGGGGSYGGLGKDGAGGGGSGGSLLIESLVVTIDGVLAANGGGGGQGNGDQGEPGHTDAAALGGHKPMEGDPGGTGSFGATLDGGDGASSASGLVSSGSGGGGAGRVRINSKSGAAAITGSVSPGLGTPCATQGKVAM